MRRKHFILALVAMLWSFSFSVAAQTDVVVVYNEAQLREALAADGVHGARLQRSAALQSSEPDTIRFGGDITLDAPIEISFEANSVLELDGYALLGASIEGTNKHLYAFYNAGKLKIQDSKGGGYIDCGVINGLDLSNEKYPDAELSIVSGRIVCHDDEGAAVMNYGITFITGGSFEGSVNALKNFQGSMSVAGDAVITGGIEGDGIVISGDVKYGVAKIGDNVYTTFSEALTAAKAMSGEVTVQIYGEVEFVDGMELDGANYTTINFVGKSAKAKVTVNQTAGGDYLTAHGKTVNFTDLTLAKANPAWAGNSGHMGNYFSIQGGTVTYTDCTFLNGACANTGTAVFNDCIFQNASEYGLWVYDDALVTVNGGTIDSKKGIKVYSEGEQSVTSTLTVKNATFTENVTAKPAVAIGYAESITLIGNTYNNTTGVLELDSSSDADCEGVTFVAQDENGNDISSEITAVDRNGNAPCGVLVDGKIYTTVTEAVKVAEAGDKVTVLYSTTEEVTFAKGVELELADGVTAENVTVVPDNLYTYAEFNALIKQNGSYDGTEEKTLVVLKDSERSYQNKKTAQFFIGATNVNITDPVETVNVTGVTFEFVDDDATNAYTSGELQIFAKNIAFTNCTFKGTAVSPWGKSNSENAETATFTNCTWKNLSGRYGVHQNRASNLTVTECTFENCERGIHTNSSTVAAITITNNTFTGIGYEYGAICLAEEGNVGNATLNITGNKAEGQVFLRQLNPNTTYAQVTEILNTEKNTYGTAYVSGSLEIQPPVAQIGTTTYTSLQAAIDAVKNGDEIILVADCDEAITFTQTKDVSFVLNGKGKTMTGNIKITARAGKDAPSTLVIKKFNFKTTETVYQFIESTEKNYYPNNITIQECTFEGPGGDNSVVAVNLKSANNITIKDCTGTGLHSFLQNYAGWNLTIDNVDVNGAAEGGFALGTVQGVTIERCDINAGRYGIRLDGGYNNNAVIADNKINAFIPVVVRYASVDGNLTFSGANEFTATNTDSLWCAIGTTEYKENGTLPTDATAKIKVSLNGTGLNAEGIYGNFVPTAKIGEAEYATLADAIAAVKNGETITLVAGVEEDVTVVQAPDMAFTIDGNDNTFKGTITVDGKSAAYATAGVTIKNVDFVAATDAVCINLGVSGNNNTRYTSNVTVDGCTFTGTDNTAVGIKSYTGGDKNLTVTNCTATKMHSLMQLKNVAGVNVANCTIEDSKNGIALGVSSNVAVTETTMDVEGYGVRADANAAANATIADCNITAFIPVVVRKASADYNLTFAGDNTMTAENTDSLWCAIGTSEYEANGTMPTAATGKVKVTLNEEDTDLDIAGVYGNFGVASIGKVNYMTFAAALDAVKNGQTITLAENATGDEASKEIEFTKNINFTITGKAPQYALPVVTFQNATVNIVNAQFQTPELDARQNATINVDNSTIVDAGGNSIVKSYYNGKINITNNSTVYAMQVTTMGYINIDKTSTLNATWQTNVYGNGMITVSNGATFNTAALHLTAQDYSGRDNTDAGRVGEPATIVVDGANLTIGKVLSAGGADYSYNSSKGINVGTIDGKSAVLDIKNGANVNIYMANAETANFGAGATVNVEASTLKVLCRAADGVATLANAGTVNVSGESNLDIKNFSGNAIAVTNATLEDLQFGGRINAFGTNNISGTSKIGGILSLGYETNPTEKVEVNITGNFNGTNVIVYTNNGVDNLLNVGAADGERTTAHFGQLGGFADVNITNADVTYGYAFIRNDLNVTNSALEIKDGVNTYFAGNAKVVIDNSTWSLPGYANIGSYGGYMYGNADVTLKKGSSITATNLGVELQEGKEVKLTLEDTSSLTATKLSNQGSIVLKSKEATITANSGVSNITTPIEDHKIGYVDGAYKVVSKVYVAKIGEQGYESLAEALTAAANGDKVELVWTEGDPAIAMNGAVFGKSVTIAGTANVDWSKGWLYVGRGGEGNATVTFDGANLASASINSNSGLGIHVSGREKDTNNKYDGTLVIKNSTIALDYLINRGAITVDGAALTVKNGFGIAGRPASETESGADATATITLENNAKLIVNNHNGMGLGQAAAQLEGYGVMNVNSGSTFETTQAFNVSAKGQMNVNGGTVKITGNLANNGTVYVAGASTLDAAVTGDGWFYMNGVTLGADTKLNGAKVAFINGENTVKGSTIKDGWFNVGIGQNAAAATAADFAQANGITLGDVTVNVSKNANIGGNGETYSGWVGSAYSADKTQHTYALNVENSLAAFGYMHVSKDGTFTVDGRSADDNKYTFDNANVNFYAGDFIINGVVTINNADAWVKYTKMSVDHVGGVLNINGDTKYESSIHNGSNTGTSLVYYNSGEVNVADTAIVEIDNATNFVDGAELNIAGNVTAKGAITGNGAINFTNDAATLTTATTGLTIGYSLNADKKVVYTEGAYKVAEKLYVAKIDDAKYETLAAAVEAAQAGDEIVLIADVETTDGVVITDKNLTIDLNGNTYTVTEGANTNNRNFMINGTSVVTVKNGTMVAAGEYSSGAYGTIRTEGTANVTLTGLKLYNYRGNGLNIKACSGTTVIVENTEIYANYGGGIEAAGGTIVINDGVTVEQKGMYSSPWNSMAISVNGGGKVTVNGGTFSTECITAEEANNQGTSHGPWVAGVLNSGGTLIINGGTFSNDNFGENSLATYARGAILADTKAKVEINGGTFNVLKNVIDIQNNLGEANNNPSVVLSGGTYNADPRISAQYGSNLITLADGYVAVENNGVWNVVKAAVKVGDTCYASLEAGLKALTDGATLTFIENITVTEAWDERYTGGRIEANNVTIDGNGKTVTFACDIQDGGNYNAPFRIVGASATFKNLTIDMSQATNSKFNRLRAISSNATDLTVTNCTFIGSETITNSRAIIFGEGSQNIPETDINISECTFKNWRYGVTDNENGKDVGNVTVTGNIFENSSVQISASSKVVFSNNSLADGGVSITSYTNVEDVSVQAINNTLDADEDNKITTNPARHTITGSGFSTPVAKTAGKYYVSIQDAVKAGAEIELISKNRYIYLDKAVEIGNSNVTLILNNRVIRATEDAKMTGGIFRLLDGANLTITGVGEINYNGNENVYAAVGVLGNATLTVESGKLVGYYYGIAGNGMKDGSTITINGGEISSVEGTGSGIYHPQNGTLNVYGGTVAGATGIYFKSGVLNITDGTIKGTGAKVEYAYNGNGSDATGDALVIENVAAGNYEAVTSVSITGGTFISNNAAPIASYGENRLVEFIGEGCNAQFSNNYIDESLLVVGYQLSTTANANGCYSVVLTMKRESMTIDVSDYADKYENTEEITVGTLTFKRTLNTERGWNVWNAFFVPFEVPLSALMENYDVAYLNDASFYDRDENGSIEEITVQYVKFTEAQKDKKLHANHPYRIRPKNEAAANMNLVLTDVVLQTTKKENRKVLKCGGVYTNIEWHGLYERSNASDFLDGNNVNDMCYAENKSGIWQNIGTVDIAPFRVMMVMTHSDEMPYTFDEDALSNVRTITLGEDEFDATGIIDIDSDSENSDVIFDLQGRRVLKPVKGNLYIINGKKVVY